MSINILKKIVEIVLVTNFIFSWVISFVYFIHTLNTMTLTETSKVKNFLSLLIHKYGSPTKQMNFKNLPHTPFVTLLTIQHDNSHNFTFQHKYLTYKIVVSVLYGSESKYSYKWYSSSDGCQRRNCWNQLQYQ